MSLIFFKLLSILTSYSDACPCISQICQKWPASWCSFILKIDLKSYWTKFRWKSFLSLWTWDLAVMHMWLTHNRGISPPLVLCFNQVVKQHWSEHLSLKCPGKTPVFCFIQTYRQRKILFHSALFLSSSELGFFNFF